MTDFAERIHKIKSRLESSRQYLNAVLDTVGDRWEITVYSDGAAWNIRQLLIHLGIAEAGMLKQVQGIATGSEGVPTDFDIDRYNKRSVEKRADTTPEQARASLAATRQQLIEWIDGLESEDILGLSGRHPTMRIMTVEEILKIIALHERSHADDIAATLNNDTTSEG